MRKIANVIQYAAPIMYEYFAIRGNFTIGAYREGVPDFGGDMRQAKGKHRLLPEQFEAMGLACWNFAFTNPGLYQVMFRVDVNCCVFCKTMPEAEVYPTWTVR
jgi:hypothetical protein